MLKIPEEYKREISSLTFTDISRQVLPDPLLCVSAGVCRRALVDKSEIIRIQMGTQSR
jgi:hypothetical protein